MAYILGLMAADGNITVNSVGTNATVRFTSKDKELVDLVWNAWESSKPITEEEGERWKWHGYKVEVYSKTMAGDLALLGVGRRKTFKLEFPPMRAKYKSHFIRGLFDGDGGVWVSSQYHKIRLYWAGTKEMLESISELLSKLDIRRRLVKLHSTGRIYELTYHNSEEILKIVKFLYRNSEGIRLERKFQKIRNFFGVF